MSAYRKILSFILFAVITKSITGCRETCSIPCGFSTAYWVAVGFTRDELYGMVVTMYNDKAFNQPRGSSTFDSTYSKHWFYPRGDTSSDTIFFGGFSTGVEPAVKFFIPSTNQTFQVTNFKIVGNLTEQVQCHEGTPSTKVVGHGCNGTPYLQSYTVNGTTITIPKTSKPEDTAGYIYIHK